MFGNLGLMCRKCLMINLWSFLDTWSFNHRCLLIPSRVFPSFFMDVQPISSWKPTAPHPQNVPVVMGHLEPLWRRISARELHLRWLSSEKKRQFRLFFLHHTSDIYMHLIFMSKQYNYYICIYDVHVYIHLFIHNIYINVLDDNWHGWMREFKVQKVYLFISIYQVLLCLPDAWGKPFSVWRPTHLILRNPPDQIGPTTNWSESSA